MLGDALGQQGGAAREEARRRELGCSEGRGRGRGRAKGGVGVGIVVVVGLGVRGRVGVRVGDRFVSSPSPNLW